MPRSPHDGAGSVLNFRTMCSVAGHVGPAVFIASSQQSLSVPKPAKQNAVKCGDNGSIRDSWPIAFSGYPRGPRVGCETWCPKHAAPNKSAETRSRTCLVGPAARGTSGCDTGIPSIAITTCSRNATPAIAPKCTLVRTIKIATRKLYRRAILGCRTRARFSKGFTVQPSATSEA